MEMLAPASSGEEADFERPAPADGGTNSHRPGVHELTDSPDRVLVVYGDRGEQVVLPRTCPHGTADLLRVGLVNVTTAELSCAHARDRFPLG